MKIETNKKHTIYLEASNLQDKIIKSFIDIIQDYSSDEDADTLQSQVDSFNTCLKHIKNGEWATLFNEGYTMMLLDDETMQYVEKFFIAKEKEHEHTDELVLIVNSHNLQYRVDEWKINF